MLKIKDDVDLKELEKFGFKYIKSIECFERGGRQLYWDDRAVYYITKDRQLQINSEGDYTLDSFIYDLIQAGLVEKV